MRARLADGSIVLLKKDCDCRTHDGPHWLHMDHMVAGMNLQIYHSALAQLDRFAELEQVRLAEKLRHMQAARIEELLIL